MFDHLRKRHGVERPVGLRKRGEGSDVHSHTERLCQVAHVRIDFQPIRVGAERPDLQERRAVATSIIEDAHPGRDLVVCRPLTRDELRAKPATPRGDRHRFCRTSHTVRRTLAAGIVLRIQGREVGLHHARLGRHEAALSAARDGEFTRVPVTVVEQCRQRRTHRTSAHRALHGQQRRNGSKSSSMA